MYFLFFFFFFFFNDTATTEIYTLSLHDALPTCGLAMARIQAAPAPQSCPTTWTMGTPRVRRSEEHTSELQSHVNLVCRLLLEKKKKTMRKNSLVKKKKKKKRNRK